MNASKEPLSPVEAAWRVQTRLRVQLYWQSWLPVATLTVVLAATFGVGALSGLYSGVVKEPLAILGSFLGFWVIVLGGAFLPKTRSVSIGTGVIVLLVLLLIGSQLCQEASSPQSVPPTWPIAKALVPELRAGIRDGMTEPLWRSKGEPNKDPVESDPIVRERIMVRKESAQIGWAASTFLVIVGEVGLIGVSLTVIWMSSRPVGWGVILRGLLAVALLVGGLLCWARHYDYNVGPPLLGELLQAVFDQRSGGIAHAKTLTKAMTGIALLAVSLVTLSLCTLLSASADPAGQNERLLAQHMWWEQVLLYLSAAALTLGAREVSLLYTWPSAWFPDAIAKDIEHLASAAATAGGVVLSIVLLAIFVPAELVLRTRARAVARSANPDGTAKAVEEWLAARDLAGLDFKSFTTLGAVLGPVLASGPLSIILKSIGG